MPNIADEKASPGLEEFSLEFHGDRVQEVNLILELVSKKDLDAVRKIAHKWKGFCEPYGFNFLEELSINLERAAIDKNLSQIENTINDIVSYLKEKEVYIRK